MSETEYTTPHQELQQVFSPLPDRTYRETSREEKTHGFFDEWRRVTMGLSLEEMGAYAAISAWAVATGDRVSPEAAHHVAHCSSRKWRRVKESLVKLGALIESEDGYLLPSFFVGRLYKTGYLYIKSPISSKLRWQVFQRDNYACRECGAKEDLTADHIVAEINGGETVLENLQTLCRPCNSGKGAA